jgi:hypothetical protein
MTDISIDDRAVIIAGIGPDGTPVKVAVDATGLIGGISAEAEVVDNTGTFIYEGYAAFGSATSATVWKIRRSAISGTVVGPTTRADGNDNYDNVWDNRAALIYT